MTTLINQQIDNFLVQQFIARGGMAEVYLAVDVQLQRQVALKVMLPELAFDVTATSRFQREAEAVARLNHPNIIQIYSTGMTPDRRPYLAMQYVAGGSLQQKLAELSRQGRQLAAADALWLGRQVAAAMQLAHAQNIVHRDLKPSNILLRENGDPVVTDLGIAAVGDGATRLTVTGSVMGTPHYMSPEQALGHPIDGRTDIYALGIILYEMLTGHVPFAADSPLAILNQHIHTPPRPLAQVKPGMPPTVYRTVALCLEKDPRDRFQTAAELANALDHALMDEGVITPKSLPPFPARGPAKKQKIWPFILLGAVILVLCAAGGFWAWNTLIPGQANPDPGVLVANRPENPATEETVMIPSTATTFLPETLPPADTTAPDVGCNGNSAGIVYISDDGGVCHGEKVVFDMAAEETACFEVGSISNSPTGDYFVVVLQCFKGDNDAFIYRADGTDKRKITAEWDFIKYDQYKWLPDSRYFVYQRINSCCADAPQEAPTEGVVWYDPQSGEKIMPDTLSPFERYHIVVIAPDDALNIHSSAGDENPVVGSIPPAGDGIEVTGIGMPVGGAFWVPVSYNGLAGWVNSDFLGGEVGDPEVDSSPLNTPDVFAAYMPFSPVIDGYLVDWPGSPSFLSAHNVYQDGSWDGTEDLEAAWQLGWDKDYLYLAVKVIDDIHVQTSSGRNIYEGDGLEIQIDTDVPGDYGSLANSDDYQLNVSPGDFANIPPASYLWRAASELIESTAIIHQARILEGGGYTLEVAIPWSDLQMVPIEGMVMGIALNVDDNDSPGTAVQEVLMSHVETRKFRDPASWGTLTLQR